MVYVYKKSDRDSTDNLVKQFTRRVQQSGDLKQIRQERFKQKPKSKAARRREAIYKDRIRVKINRLKKLGHFDEDALKDLKRKMRQEN